MKYYIVRVKVIEYHYETYKIQAHSKVNAADHWDIDGVKVNQELGGQDFQIMEVKEE